MDLLLWIIAFLLILGLIGLFSIKKQLKKGENLSNEFMIWWIVGTSIWGIASIIFVVTIVL